MALCVLCVIAAIICYEAFLDSPDEARAQTGKSLATSEALSNTKLLQALIAEQKKTNTKIESLTTLLQSGNVKVKIVADEKPEPAPRRAPGQQPG
ncbi:MAG: hypothetical protein KGY81_08165 [Phycisphaerae bacterium]|jgi:ssDNA-binding replication factor A large subunit|nr:hypothetical protein [Phycisphaerae bacterium]